MATKKKKAAELSAVPYENDRRKMSASEALTALFGFLTTREKPLIFSMYHDCAPIAQIFEAFMSYHKLTPLREGMHRETHLSKLDYLTNEPGKKMTIADPVSVLNVISEELYKLQPGEQNKVIGKLLQDLKRLRLQKHSYNEKTRRNYDQEEARAYDELSELNNIISGNYSVL